MTRSIVPRHLRASLFAAAVLAAGGGCVSEPDVGTTAAEAIAGPPHLYRDPQHGSPVRGEADDLILIPGTNIAPSAFVVYAAVADTTQSPVLPSPLPTGQGAQSGRMLPLAVDAQSTTVRLPDTWVAGQSYALWVVNPAGTSDPVLVDDARPMWLSPGADGDHDHAFAYRTAPRPGLGRILTVVGRNLEPAPLHHTIVRLTATFADLAPIDLIAEDDGDPATRIERYAARVTLPATLQAGDYAVAVSRDGASWVAVSPDPILTIRPDPAARPRFAVGNYTDAASGPCLAGDTIDDTLCITRAIHAAELAGGGDVTFSPGTWRVDRDCWGNTPADHGSDSYPLGAPSYRTCVGGDRGYGILLPAHVALVAASGATTRPTIVTGAAFGGTWLTHYHPPGPTTPDLELRTHVFTLMGDNRIEGLRFVDEYQPVYARGPSGGTVALYVLGNDVTVTAVEFDDQFTAIDAWWHYLPVFSQLGVNVLGSKNVTITGVDFHVYKTPASFTALEDSVVAGNHFYPGAGPEPIALAARGSRHLVVRDNQIDELDPAHPGGPHGWRAGMFFPHMASHEQILIADNQFSCMGSRVEDHMGVGQRGDGEAISFDANGSSFGFAASQAVTAADTSVITVTPPAGERLMSHDRFVGLWLTIDAGPGLGQSRKIVAAVPFGNQLTLTVSPPFDVAPAAGASRVIAGVQTWQAAVVDNQVDNACSTTLPAAVYDHTLWSGGAIASYVNQSDSAIEANRLTQTRGIQLFTQYHEDPHPGHAGIYQMVQYAIDVRGNTIDGSFGAPVSGPEAGHPHPQNTTGGGIDLAAQIVPLDLNDQPTYVAGPDRPGFAVTVAHNTVRNAGLVQLGSFDSRAISLAAGGNLAAEATQPGYVDTLVFGNVIERVPSPSLFPSALFPPWQFPNGPGDPLAIGNGVHLPGAKPAAGNYPQSTTVCNNVTTFAIGDFWPVATSLLACP